MVWHSSDHARQWIQRMDAPEHDRSEQFALLVRLLPFDQDAPVRLCDLGAGAGAVAGALLAAYPRAQAVLLDLNEEMARLAAERLSEFAGRYSYRLWDMNQPGWPAEAAGPFDLIVSSLAIHHLSDARKEALFREAYERLVPGGAFVNIDVVRPADEYLAERYEAARPAESPTAPELPPDHKITETARRQHDSAIGLLNDQLIMLQNAGFTSVDCFWKQLTTAMYGGFKPSGGTA